MQDVIVRGAEPPFGKPVVAQPAVSPPMPEGVYRVETLPDGSLLYHYANGAHVTNNATTGEYNMQVPKEDGTGYLVYSRIRNDDSSYTVQQFDLNAQGELLGQQTGTQQNLQSDITWEKPIGATPEQTGFNTHLPDIGQVPNPGAPTLVADAGTGPMTDAGPVNGYGGGSLPAPVTQQPDTPRDATNGSIPLSDLASLLTTEQGEQLLTAITGLGLSGGDIAAVTVYTNPDGSRILANAEGEVIGTFSKRRLPTATGRSSTSPVKRHR